MCSQRLHKPSPSNRTCLYICLRKNCSAEWQSRGKEGESTEWMNGVGEGKKRKENSEGSKRRGKGETAAVCASVAESWNCLLARGAHMSGGRWGGGGGGGGGGGERREGRALQRAGWVRPPPLPPCCISQHIWWSLHDRIENQRAVGTYFVFCGVALHVLLACRLVGRKMSGFAKCGVWKHLLTACRELECEF